MKATTHKLLAPPVRKALDEYPDFILKVDLFKICEEKGISFRDLSFMTGLRTATITEINQGKGSLNMNHIKVIAITLGITDISELIQFSMTPQTRDDLETRRNMPITNEMAARTEANRRYMQADKKSITGSTPDERDANLEKMYDDIYKEVTAGL